MIKPEPPAAPLWMKLPGFLYNGRVKKWIILSLQILWASLLPGQSLPEERELFFLSRQSLPDRTAPLDFVLGPEEKEPALYDMARGILLEGFTEEKGVPELVNILKEKDRINRKGIRDVRIGREKLDDDSYQCRYRIIYKEKNLPHGEGSLYFVRRNDQWLLEDWIIH